MKYFIYLLLPVLLIGQNHPKYFGNKHEIMWNIIHDYDSQLDVISDIHEINKIAAAVFITRSAAGNLFYNGFVSGLNEIVICDEDRAVIGESTKILVKYMYSEFDAYVEALGYTILEMKNPRIVFITNKLIDELREVNRYINQNFELNTD